MKKKFTRAAAFLMAVAMSGVQVFAAEGGAIFDNQNGQVHERPGNNGNYSHGAAEVVTEDMLVTESAISSDYKVNNDIQGDAKDGNYVKYFNHENIEDFYIDIDENNWNYMLQNANQKPTVLTDSVTIGNEMVQYAGIKTKGNLTLSSVWNSDSDRFSFTVNFGKYIKKKTYGKTQNFHGLSKVALNNIYGDASLMKEYLSYELMTKMGVATPCYSLVNLYVNNEFWGVYMMVESVDNALTERTLGEKSDFLVKPESAGGDLIYDSSLDSYINENGEFDFSDAIYPTQASEPLYKYNGLWENDEDTFNDVKNMLPTVFKWLKELNELNSAEDANTEEYIEKLENIMNVDEILRYFAANTYLVNLDSYQSEKMQNYTLYINESGVANVMPWDYNYSFGGYGVSDASAMVNFDINNPVIDVTIEQRPLLNVLLQNEELKAKYKQYLSDCCIIASKGGTTSDGVEYESNNFSSILKKYEETLTTVYAKDSTAFYTVSRYMEATDSLSTLIKDRTTAVLQQLDGNNEKVSTTVNLQTIGDSVGGGMGGEPGQGDRPGQMSTVTLTDESKGVQVTGRFPEGSNLSVVDVTNGKEYDIAKNLLTDISDKFTLYKITTDSGMPGDVSGGASGVPQMPGDVSGGAADVPQMPGNVSGGASGVPQMPGNISGGAVGVPQKPGNVNGGEMFVTDSSISFKIQIPEDYVGADIGIYKIDTENNTMTEISSTVSENSLSFECADLGLFAIVSKAESSAEYKKGDINNSGKVDLDDVTLSLKGALRLIKFNNVELAAADIDGNGKVDLTDTIAILKAALEIEKL